MLLFSCSVVSDSLKPHGLQQTRSPVPHHLPKFAQVHVHCVSDAIQPHHPLLPSFPSALNLPSIRDFSNELAVHIRWPTYWSFSFSISLSKDYSGVISLKIDWFDLAVQGNFRSLLQQHSSKASFLWCLAFFMVQFSQSYVTTGKTIALTIQPRSDVSAFQHTVWVCHHCPAKQQSSSDFMAAVTICSDFGVQEGEICHYFHLSLFHLP